MYHINCVLFTKPQMFREFFPMQIDTLQCFRYFNIKTKCYVKKNNAFELRLHSKYVFGCISFKLTKLVKKAHQRNPKCMSYQTTKGQMPR